MNSIISRTELVIAFEKNPLIRRRIFEFEDGLRAHFQSPFYGANIPDTYDPTFARIEAASQNGHSLLQVSQTSLSIVTQYDENLRDKPTQIRSYLEERVEKTRDVLKPEKIQFFGFVVDILFYLEKDQINQLLAAHTGFSSISDNTIDFTFTHSRRFREKFYLILSVSKFVENAVPLLGDGEEKEGKEKDELKYGIQIRLDLNTKSSYHAGDEFDNGYFDQLFETLFKLISESTLQSYLSGNLK